MNNGQYRPKRKKLFKPDSIADKLYAGIHRDLNQPISYRADIDASRFFRKIQKNAFLKKYLRETCDSDLETATYIKFLYVNEHMKDYSSDVIVPTHDRVSHLGDWSLFSNVLHRAKHLMKEVLGDLNEEDWFVECRNSTGSSIGVPYIDTSIERKFTFPISITERAQPMFERYMSFDSSLKESVYNYNTDVPLTGIYDVVQGSRATTVEKTNSISRMICIEPTGNMFLQQGLMHLMYSRMKRVGLDVQSLPERHKQLAYESSITAQNATIDWSSASDCVSIELLRWLLPPKWFYAVDLTRSSITSLQGENIRLNMFSTMGNAVTFPLETLIFWTFSMAVLAEEQDSNTILPNWKDRFRCSVFGDDCIVPSSIAPTFIECMQKVGFIINTDKSFIDDGQFRESCGGDYYRGIDTRPFNLRSPTSNRLSALEPWLNIITNSILKKYRSYFGSLSYLYDKHVLKYLFSVYRSYNLRIKPIPDYFPDDSGVKFNGDLTRLQSIYLFRLSPVIQDIHGIRTFNYCRYLYRDKRYICDELRYAVWLKKPYITSKPISSLIEGKMYKRRKGGGYVVAKASSSFWSETLTIDKPY